jgi:hypothetical protein
MAPRRDVQLSLPGLAPNSREVRMNRRPPQPGPAHNLTPDDAPGHPPYNWPGTDYLRTDTNGLPHDETRPNYRGPMPGQTVMGVDRLHEGNVSHFGQREPYHVDPHGFVLERGVVGHDQRGRSLPGSGDASALYGTHGGLYGKTMQEHLQTEGYTPSEAVDAGLVGPAEMREHNKRVKEVTAHWNRQPLVQMSTDTLLHTGQAHHVTEGDEGWDDTLEGRNRINAIRDDVEHGERIRKPAWIAKVNGRHFALDGHHRIVAAREGGAETFPARLWDMDAEAAARTRSVDKLPENVRVQMRRQVDAGHLRPADIHSKWRSDVMRDAKPPRVMPDRYGVM